MHAIKNRNRFCQLIQRRKIITTKITAGRMVMIKTTHKHRRHAQEQFWGTKRMLRYSTQWEDQKTIRHVYGRDYEREAVEIIRNIVH